MKAADISGKKINDRYSLDLEKTAPNNFILRRPTPVEKDMLNYTENIV